MDIHLIAEPGAEICDFCSAPFPEWGYPCETISHPVVKSLVSVEDWAACNTCSAFIEAGEREKLLAHSVERFLQIHPEDHASLMAKGSTAEEASQLIRGFIQSLHQMFFLSRKGPRYAHPQGRGH